MEQNLGLFIEEKINRLTRWINGERAPPFEIQINPTNKCNLNCVFCRPKGYDNIKEIGLSAEKWVNIIEEASKLGVKYCDILGGEPFIEPKKVIPIMESIKRYGLSGITVTNGTLLTEDIIKKLIEIEWDDLIFSMDGACPATHDNLRGKEKVFEKCTNSIRLINHYKKISGKDKPRLQTFFVITNKNYQEMPQFISLAKELKINKIVFQAMIETHPPSKNLKLDEQDYVKFRQYAEQAKELADKEGITTNIADFFDCLLIDKANKTEDIIKNDSFNKHIPCYEPWYFLQVSPEGYVSPCSVLENRKVNVKQESLEEIWYGDFFKRFRKKIASGNLDKRCSRCCSGQILKNRELKMELEKQLGDKVSIFKDSKNSFFNTILKIIGKNKDDKKY